MLGSVGVILEIIDMFGIILNMYRDIAGAAMSLMRSEISTSDNNIPGTYNTTDINTMMGNIYTLMHNITHNAMTY